jgi:hypothetical protein
MITFAQVIRHFESVKAAADFFDIEPSAVYQWKDRKKGAIPRERELELMLRKPEHFPQKAA